VECKDVLDAEAFFLVKIKRMGCPLLLYPLDLEYLIGFISWAMMLTQSPLRGWSPLFD